MIEETEITSLTQYATEVAGLAELHDFFWFRGVRDGNKHKLVPSLYRHSAKKTPDDFRNLENAIMSTFADRAPPFSQGIPSESMELLFFMQHHGAPTRLLDLSENPFAALFFALETALWEDDSVAVDAAVWVVNPIALNKVAFANNDGSDKVLSPHDDLLNAYLPKGPTKNSGKLPVAMFGVHNSRRIVAQRGVFILFGSNVVPMEDESALSSVNGLMRKLVIKKEYKKDIARALSRMGFTDSVIYPDLDGLGREIRSQYEFWRTA